MVIGSSRFSFKLCTSESQDGAIYSNEKRLPAEGLWNCVALIEQPCEKITSDGRRNPASCESVGNTTLSSRLRQRQHFDHSRPNRNTVAIEGQDVLAFLWKHCPIDSEGQFYNSACFIHFYLAVDRNDHLLGLIVYQIYREIMLADQVRDGCIDVPRWKPRREARRIEFRKSTNDAFFIVLLSNYMISEQQTNEDRFCHIYPIVGTN